MKDNLILIGLDFETSTGDVRNLAPIQLGMTVGDDEFATYIGGWKFDKESDVKWSEWSAKIHNIQQEWLDLAPDIFKADLEASYWLFSRVEHIPRMNRIVTGWNVGSFDRRVVADWFPILTQILSYRTLDLNTVCFFVADLLNESYEKLKKGTKRRAQEELGGENWHDALFDAKAGMLTYKYLLEMADINVEKLLRS